MADNDSTFVDPNTDDLDAFSDLLTGKAKPIEQKPEDAEPKAEDGNPSAEDDKDVDTTGPVDGEGDEPEDNKSEDDDPSDDDDSDEEDKLRLRGKKKTAKERISELTAKAREAERRAAELARKVEELSAKPDNPSGAPEAKPANTLDTSAPDPDAVLDNGEPKYPLGEYDPAYIRDLTKFTIAQERAEAEKKAAEEAAKREQEQARIALATEWEGKLEKVEAELPDIRTKAATLEDTFSSLDPAYGEYLATAIMSLDHGPEVLYYLANNLKEAKSIVAMGPAKATIALGVLEARFQGDSTPEAKPRQSSAPTPPPRNRGGATVVSVRADTDDLDAFEREFFKKK